MADSVKFIFKTLIKVPCYIMISYIIANVFFFSLFYFKFLGISYAVMQTALENNYLPDNEKNALQRSIDDIIYPNGLSGNHSEIIVNASVYCPDNQRVQYGHLKEVGVTYTYKWIWPLAQVDMSSSNPYIQSYGGRTANLNTVSAGTGGMNSDWLMAGAAQVTDPLEYGDSGMSEAEIKNRINSNAVLIPITIKYRVPGLQYYADLAD